MGNSFQTPSLISFTYLPRPSNRRSMSQIDFLKVAAFFWFSSIFRHSLLIPSIPSWVVHLTLFLSYYNRGIKQEVKTQKREHSEPSQEYYQNSRKQKEKKRKKRANVSEGELKQGQPITRPRRCQPLILSITHTLNSFKTVMLNYFLASLLISYNPNNPQTFRSICLKCTTVLPLSSKIT